MKLYVKCYTLLIMASRFGHLDIVRYLLDKYKVIDLELKTYNSKGKESCTTLHWATEEAHISTYMEPSVLQVINFIITK